MPDRLEEIKERWKAAEAGPWHWQCENAGKLGEVKSYILQSEDNDLPGMLARYWENFRATGTRDAIAAAPEDVKWLLWRINQLMDEVHKFKARRDSREIYHQGRYFKQLKEINILKKEKQELLDQISENDTKYNSRYCDYANSLLEQSGEITRLKRENRYLLEESSDQVRAITHKDQDIWSFADEVTELTLRNRGLRAELKSHKKIFGFVEWILRLGRIG